MTARLVFKDKMCAADHHTFISDRTGDSVGHQIFHLGMHFLVGKAAISGSLYHSVGHRMGEMLFQAGRQPEHILLAVAAKGNHL